MASDIKLSSAIAVILVAFSMLHSTRSDVGNFPREVNPAEITTVHLISSCHLDVGFADTAANILNRYFDSFFPEAISTANQLKQSGREERLVFTTHSYLVYLFLNCPPNMGLHCPNASSVARFEKAVEAGDIVWHAYAFNVQPEIMETSMFEFGVQLSHWLDDRFKKPHKTTMSQRDVPGMTRGVVPILSGLGVRAITVGVNSASMPPAVPRAFRWQDPASGSEILAMWHPGGYGGPPSSPNSTLLVPGLTDALALAIRGDNKGPPSVEEIAGNYASLKKLFPNATVVASTYDAFVARLLTVRERLPVVAQEIGDTWIYGTASDPGKTSQFREIMSLRSECLATGKCSLDDTRFFNFSVLLLKNAEHTWGKDIKKFLNDTYSWTNENFADALSGKNFVDVINSWIEQRTWGLTYSVEALGDHPLAGSIRAALKDLVFDGDVPLDGFAVGSKPYRYRVGDFSISFDETTGAVVELTDTRGGGASWASAEGPLFTLLYQTFTPEDYDTFLAQYLYQQTPFAAWDFGKPGLELNATEHFEDPGSLSQLYVSRSGTSFVTSLQYNGMLHHDFGAPGAAWLRYDYVPDDQTFDVTVYVQWQTTRRPQSLSLVFKPPVGGMNVSKLGSIVDVADVVKNGSQHLHGQYRGGVAVVHSTTPTAVMNVTAADSTVVCIGTPTPFPTPPTPPDLTEGFSFNLLNNAWGTNYVMWYPFVKDEAYSKFRFKLTLKNSKSNP